MPPRRVIVTVVSLLALLHIYIGMRLLPAMELGAVGLAAGCVMLALSTLLVPTGLHWVANAMASPGLNPQATSRPGS